MILLIEFQKFCLILKQGGRFYSVIKGGEVNLFKELYLLHYCCNFITSTFEI